MRKSFTLLSGLVLIVLLFGLQKADAQLIDNGEIIIDSVIAPDGRIAVKVIVPGIPPDNYKAPIAYPTDASVILPSVPAFNWSFGCSATAAAMIAGHYDNMGYPNMYDGPTNSGVMPMDNSAWPDVYINGEWRHQCPLSATRDGVDGRTTRGHVDDYWVSYESTAQDPYIGNWTQHTYGQCTGDYMKTNQSVYGNIDGSTGFWYWSNNSPMTAADLVANGWDDEDGGYGFKLFFESRGYTVTDMYNQRRYGYNGINSGFTYADFIAEIDAGHLVLIQVTNHTMVGYGYDDATNLVYIHDTWDYSDHTMTWGGYYSGLLHRGVTIVELASSTINVWTGNSNTFWGNATNWSLNHVPTATETVEIPNVNMPCRVDYTNKVCNNLTIYPGATLEIYDNALTVNNDLSVHGTVSMMQDNSYLNVMHDIVWESGSFLNTAVNSSYIQVWGDWNFESGANVNPTQGYIDFEGTATSWIRCYDNSCSFYRLRAYKTSGAITNFSNLSTEDLVINGLTFISSTAVFNSSSSHDIIMRGSFNYYGPFNFNVSGSSVIFDGVSQTMNKYSTNDGIFNNVVFSSSTGMTIANGGLTAMGNVTINQGFFNPGVDPVSVGGNWTNYMGASGFVEGTGRVIFNGGNYHQYCSNETFNELEINKPLGSAFRMNGTNVVCAAYDWTAGAVDVLTGSFTANNLLDGLVAGAFYTNAGGTINLTSAYVDLAGELHNFGGDINLDGALSYWPYTHDAVVEMTSGTIDLTCGLRIYNTASYSLTDNITGGTIKTAGYFAGERADFTPTAGTIELYGPTDASLSQTNGCTVHNVIINKAADDGLTYQSFGVLIDERSGEIISDGGKDNSLNLATDFTITGNLNIDAGSLTLSGHTLDVDKDCNVYGTFNMTNAADILYVGTNIYDNFDFWGSSIGNITAGNVYLASWMRAMENSALVATTGNTAHFTGSNSNSGLRVDNTNSSFGHVHVNKSTGNFFIYCDSYDPIIVNGNFTMHPGDIMDMQSYSLVVHGDFTDNATSTIYVYNGPVDNGKGGIETGSEGGVPATKSGAKGAYLEIDSDFLLYGLMDVGDGDVYLHGGFSIATSGILNIDGGTVIDDAPHGTDIWHYINGSLNITSGLFEISNNSINFGASSVNTISGGIIRAGAFSANYAGTFLPTGGTVETIGAASENVMYCSNGNFFYDLIINRETGYGIYLYTDITIQNDFTINSGILNSNSHNIYIGGDWTNNVGTGGFNEGSGRVVFDGPGPVMQYINSDETFNILENNTVEAIRINSSLHTVTCNSYDWTSGGISVLGGTFIANDLADGGLYGNFWGLTNSEIHLYQDAASGQYIDLYGNLHVHGNGLIKVYGGADHSYWGGVTSSVTVNTGGIIDIVDWGIRILNNPVTFTETITDGTIRMSGYFVCARSDFNPTGGTFEFYGGTDASINVTAGSTLFNVLINKSGGDKSSFQFKDRDGKVIESTKTNMAYLSNDLDIEGELIVDEGTLSLNANTINCYGDININDGGILNVNDNSTLALDAGSYLHTNTGGIFQIIGSLGNEAQITHVSSSLYSLWIEDGGTISAEHALFEYMSYVYLRPGSIVDPVHSFHYCTFQEGNGSAGYPLIAFYNTQTLQINNAIFPTNTWGGDHNVKKSNNLGDITFYNATGGFAGPEYEHDDYDKIHWTMTPYEVDLEVFLEGPFNVGTTKMDLDLNNLDLIPTSQPFDTNPLADWYYEGTESVGSIPDFVVDWVLVELRDAPNVASALPGRVIARQAGFVLNNGEVVGLDGLNALDFEEAVFNNLYVNIWHRNHLGVISANPLIDVGGTYSYNFFSGSGQAYGGAAAQKNLGGSGVWGMFSGDASGGGVINTWDLDGFWSIDVGNQGYLEGDHNLNSQADNVDKNDYWFWNLGNESQIPGSKSDDN
ncbi:MAG: hypothetical protein K8R74_10825 [Bacteroidales bacterium]|nr:hypothetical protein [Bacteroidales bacterium]